MTLILIGKCNEGILFCADTYASNTDGSEVSAEEKVRKIGNRSIIMSLSGNISGGGTFDREFLRFQEPLVSSSDSRKTIEDLVNVKKGSWIYRLQYLFAIPSSHETVIIKADTRINSPAREINCGGIGLNDSLREYGINKFLAQHYAVGMSAERLEKLFLEAMSLTKKAFLQYRSQFPQQKDSNQHPGIQGLYVSLFANPEIKILSFNPEYKF